MKMQTYKIKEICEIKSGKRLPAGSDFSFDKTNYPYIRSRDIKKGKIRTDALVYIDKEVHEKIKRYIIECGDIAITIVANVGDVGYCEKELNGFNLTENAVRLTKFQNEINTKYLTYYLSQPFSKMYMESLAAGAAQAKLGIYKIENIKVNIPEKTIQDRIVKVINCYDVLIENNNKRIKLLETMAEELYKEWFVRCRFKNVKKDPKHKIIPKGWVYGNNINGLSAPKSWEYKKLDSVGEFVRGKNITSDEMHDGNIEVISAGLEPSGFHNEYNVAGQSLTVSASGANAGYLSYHLDNIWAADCSYYSGEHIWFIYHSLHFIKSVIDNLQVGSAQPHVYAKNINKLFIIVPDCNVIQEFENKVKSIYCEIKVLQDKNKVLIKQRDYLLPRLMSGKLSVENKNII